MNTAIVVILVSIIVINYSSYKTTIRCQDKDKLRKSCQLQPIRSDVCLETKIDPCPSGSYKQCTNNVMNLHKCDCRERSFELCPIHQQVNETCFELNHNPDKTIYVKYPNTHLRVNKYRSDKLGFNKNK